MLRLIVAPRRLAGAVAPPGDKSISHRAVILNGLARGSARVTNLSLGADCASTIACMKALGVSVHRDPDDPTTLTVDGRDGRLEEPTALLDAGNSGTTMRLISGVLAGQPFFSTITGDRSLRSRPMGRIVTPLRLMGARVDGRGGGTLAPLAFRGGDLEGIEYDLPVASAQLKSCLLIAGIAARGRTRLRELAPTRDHTERMLAAMGVPVTTDDGTVALEAGSLRAVDIVVPGDISAAAFFLVAAAIHPDARIRVTGVGMNPSRTAILGALQRMGARVSLENAREAGGEPVADIVAESSALTGIEIAGEEVPGLIDELPVLAVAASVARGTTVIRDAAELRIKEADRIRSMAQGLSRMGARVEERPDGLVIHGGAALHGATVRSYGDHRIAMSLAVAGLVAKGETGIQGAECAVISNPGFWDQLQSVGSEDGNGRA